MRHLLQEQRAAHLIAACLRLGRQGGVLRLWLLFRHLRRLRLLRDDRLPVHRPPALPAAREGAAEIMDIRPLHRRFLRLLRLHDDLAYALLPPIVCRCAEQPLDALHRPGGHRGGLHPPPAGHRLHLPWGRDREDGVSKKGIARPGPILSRALPLPRAPLGARLHAPHAHPAGAHRPRLPWVGI